jgi:hypothetical protein
VIHGVRHDDEALFGGARTQFDQQVSHAILATDYPAARKNFGARHNELLNGGFRLHPLRLGAWDAHKLSGERNEFCLIQCGVCDAPHFAFSAPSHGKHSAAYGHHLADIVGDANIDGRESTADLDRLG